MDLSSITTGEGGRNDTARDGVQLCIRGGITRWFGMRSRERQVGGRS